MNQPESKAFSRWQEGKFLDVERQFAKLWRNMIAEMNFEHAMDYLTFIGISIDDCRTLYDAKSIADSVVNEKRSPFDLMKFIFSALKIPPALCEEIMKRYSIYGYPPLSQFAPYAAYVINIEIFFFVAVAANLISSARATNKIDIAYLHYLPFCSIFTSSDKLHRKCAPLFLRDTQKFIWGPDLKNDLKKINDYFKAFPDEEKEKGLYTFATKPPVEGNFLVSKLWDRFMPGWRDIKETKIETREKKQTESKLLSEIKEFTNANPLDHQEVDFSPDDADMLCLQRSIRKRKGSWWQLPKDFRINDQGHQD